MREIWEKLRAVRGIEWLLGIGALALLALTLMGQGTPARTNSSLEERLCAVLSKVQGAGNVDVIIYTAQDTAGTAGAFGESTQRTSERPSGVVVVADGAGDLQVRIELAQAVKTLLSLPASAVEVLQRDVNQ